MSEQNAPTPTTVSQAWLAGDGILEEVSLDSQGNYLFKIELWGERYSRVLRLGGEVEWVGGEVPVKLFASKEEALAWDPYVIPEE